MTKRGIGVLAALALALAMSLSACGGGDESSNDLLASIEEQGTITVSTDPAYPPQSELNESTGEYEGFDIDVATEVAKRLGVDIAWEAPVWDTIIAGSWNGRWDVSVGSMTITPERAEVLHFTAPYYYTPASIAVNEANTSITDASGLDGKTVGVCGGCTYDAYLQGTLEIALDESGTPEAVPSVVTDPEIKTYDTDSTAIQDLALGDGRRLDAVVSARPTLEAAVKAGTPIKVVGDPLYYEPLAIAVDRSSQLDPTSLVQRLTEIVNEMHEDGTLSELSTKWYGVDLTVAEGS
jgi:polar amino acid transport system substrate-binding protein